MSSLLCLHIVIISDLELRVSFLSAKRMAIFSVRHKSHFLPPEENANALLCMDHLTVGSRPLLFNFHMYDERVVDFLFHF